MARARDPPSSFVCRSSGNDVSVKEQPGPDRDADSTAGRTLFRADRVEPGTRPDADPVLREPLLGARRDHPPFAARSVIAPKVGVDGDRQRPSPCRITVERRSNPHLPGQVHSRGPTEFRRANIPNHTARPERPEYGQHANIEVERIVGIAVQVVAGIQQGIRISVANRIQRRAPDILQRGADMNVGYQ